MKPKERVSESSPFALRPNRSRIPELPVSAGADVRSAPGALAAIATPIPPAETISPSRPSEAIPGSSGDAGGCLDRVTVEAHVDVGFGNALFIRGIGARLGWDAGQPMTCLERAIWVWSAPAASGPGQFKLLLNDQTWCEGDNMSVEAGGRIRVNPRFP
jgi:hypothetical protein